MADVIHDQSRLAGVARAVAVFRNFHGPRGRFRLRAEDDKLRTLRDRLGHRPRQLSIHEEAILFIRPLARIDVKTVAEVEVGRRLAAAFVLRP